MSKRIEVQSLEQLKEFHRLKKIIPWYFADKILIYPEEWESHVAEEVAARKDEQYNRIPETIKRNVKKEKFFPQEGIK